MGYDAFKTRGHKGILLTVAVFLWICMGVFRYALYSHGMWGGDKMICNAKRTIESRTLKRPHAPPSSCQVPLYYNGVLPGFSMATVQTAIQHASTLPSTRSSENALFLGFPSLLCNRPSNIEAHCRIRLPCFECIIAHALSAP